MMANDSQGWKKKQGLTNSHSDCLGEENLEHYRGPTQYTKLNEGTYLVVLILTGKRKHDHRKYLKDRS